MMPAMPGSESEQHRVGHQAEGVVVQGHEHEHRQHADHECAHALVDILLAQARSDRALLDHIHRRCQRA
jgi:hypothetical protein